MSNPNSRGRGGSASQRQVFDPQCQHESNIDPDLDSSLSNTDSSLGSSNFMSAHTGQGMAQAPVGGYANCSPPGHSGNMQSNTGFIPHTPTPPMKRQNSENGSASFATPQKTKYDSPSNTQNGVGAPYTPRNYNNNSFLNANSPYQNSARPMAPSPLNMAVGNSADRVPNYNNFLNSQSPQVPQSFLNMNSTPQQHRGTQSFNEPLGMLNSPQGRQSLMSIANMSQQRRGPQPPFNQNRSYGSNDNNIGAGVFGSGFDLAALANQEQDWNMLGSGNQLGFGDEESMDREEFQFGNGQQPFAYAQYPSPTTLASQAVGHPSNQHGTDGYEEEEVDEYQNESDADEDSDYEVEKGTPSTSNTASNSSPSGPNNNLSKYQGIIKSEGDYKALLAKRAKLAKDSVSRGRQDTCPTQNDEILEYINELFDAIMNTDDIVDKKAQDGRKAQAARRLDDNYYSAEVVEIVCWEIFFKCRQACKGIRLVDAYHKTKREGNDVHETFKERWNAIIKACQHSKAVCKQVLDPSYLDRLVDAPEAQFQMKLNNKKINAERDKQNRLGRMAIKNGVSLNDIPGMLKEEEAEDSVVTPSKRPARQRGSAVRRRTPKQVKYEYPDEDGEDGDPTYETPVKKERAGTMTVSSRPIRTPHKRTPRSATTSSTKTKNALSHPPPTPELDMEYCVAICDLLHISPEFAKQFTLEQLRVFARPYNSEQLEVPWYHESFTKGQHGLGHQMFHANGKLIPHFTWKLRDLQVLAIARGELQPTGESIDDHQFDYYTVGDDPELKKSLGITFNTFGVKFFNEQPPQEAYSS
ncbi:hypothetical protein DL98DRAFT_649106 [Cadophora sp. DSE1049]|nr:hypothetical protein DL98DRAFT_649106 [Cadophora sp. DSE1049]